MLLKIKIFPARRPTMVGGAGREQSSPASLPAAGTASVVTECHQNVTGCHKNVTNMSKSVANLSSSVTVLSLDVTKMSQIYPKIDGFWPRGIFGQDGGKSCLPAKGRSEPERWRAAAGFAAAPGHDTSRAARECSWPGLMSLHAEASWSSGSD